MESIIPQCTNSKPCQLVCNVQICKAIPFICADNQCSCHSLHQKCATNIKWIIIKQYFSDKLKKSSSNYVDYFTQIDELYKSVIKQIEKSYSQIKNISDTFGLGQLEREVYQKLKLKKFFQLTGELISKLQIELMQAEKQFKISIIEKEKKQIEKQATVLVQMLERLTKLNVKEGKIFSEYLASFKLDSKITQDIETLSSFFPHKKIASMKLLYRASENNFQVSQFYDECANIQHTITILKTEFGNVIGGYTPLPWKKNKSPYYQYSTDNSRQSFIFSLTNKHKLQLIEGLQQYSIQHHINCGPIFGRVDFGISNKANQNLISFARPGFTYNYNNQYILDTQQSYTKFIGQSSGNRFKVSQWQVYSIVFE